MQDLVVVVDRPGIDGIGDLTLGPVRVGRAQSGADRIQADAQLVEQIRIQLRAHRRIGAAAHIHLADATHLRQLLRQDGVGLIVDIAAA